MGVCYKTNMRRSMKQLLVITTLSLMTSCYQEVNSNSFDDRYSVSNGIDTSTANGKRLSDAYDVLSNKCMNCHTGYHNNWSDFTTDSKWIEANLVESNNAYLSSLVLRMKNTGGNMPKDNPQIKEEDFDIIIEWIDNI